MIGIFDSGTGSCRERLERLRPRAAGALPEVAEAVRKIIEDVSRRGDVALREHAARLDGVPSDAAAEVPRADFAKALSIVDPAVVKALKLARERIEWYHAKQVSGGYTMRDRFGSRLEMRVEPVDRAGVYIPGGKAAYPSTVLMNVIPARVAGVGEVIATSPGASLESSPVILAACAIAGVDRLFRFGGAQAVAALAFGTETVPACPVIVGPGNAYVAEAKRQLYGRIGIESVAGPSEIVVIADSSAGPAEIAADMLSQAEHDETAAAILLTDSPQLARLVQHEIMQAVEVSPRRNILEQSVPDRGMIILTGSLAEAVEVANGIAPEHVELMVRRPEGLARHIRNAGAIFLGRTTPEAMGDYLAGSNHVLPTGGAARFSGPLGVGVFLKRTSVVYTSEKALNALGPSIVALARAEGLFEHARSVEIRLPRTGPKPDSSPPAGPGGKVVQLPGGRGKKPQLRAVDSPARAGKPAAGKLAKVHLLKPRNKPGGGKRK